MTLYLDTNYLKILINFNNIEVGDGVGVEFRI